MNGGLLVARTLERHGVRFLFTLCGGHISPILVESKRLGLEVLGVRHEATAVFAADAVARLSGVPGVAAVTAGPGVTNTITAVKNAQLAQSPVVLLGGATATVLDGRGSLQDIDQMALFRPHVKWLASARRVRDLVPALEEAFGVAAGGVPGPVFLECPVDLLYDESVVREWYRTGSGGRSWRRRLERLYLEFHLRRLFAGVDAVPDAAEPAAPAAVREARRREVVRAAAMLERAERPVLLVGSQATLEAERIERTAAAVERLGLPTYLSGMARGLLGRRHELHRRHQRRKALKESDLVILAGVPCDFRLDYGRQFGRATRLVGVNRSRRDLRLNRRPHLGVQADPGRFLVALAERVPSTGERWSEWHLALRSRDDDRESEIDSRAAEEGEGVNPLRLFRELDRVAGEEALLVADGGDFVGTAAYVLSPRRPLSWLDPGVFGTLGVGGGFALGAKLSRPESEVWILYGDGSAGYSLAEIDTYVRHDLPVIALVGNDASWAQIAREQVPLLGDAVGTELRRTDYECVAEGFGGRGLRLTSDDDIVAVLEEARRLAAAGDPVVVNVHLAESDFRRGSISM